MTAMLPAHLTEALNSLGEAANGLGNEIRDDRRQRRKDNRRLLVLIGLVAALVLGLLTLGVSNRALGSRNAELNRQNAELNRQNAVIIEQISDCTTAGGKCYERGNQRYGDAIRELLRSNVWIAQCARTAETDADLERCVTEKIAAGRKTPPPMTPTPAG